MAKAPSQCISLSFPVRVIANDDFGACRRRDGAVSSAQLSATTSRRSAARICALMSASVGSKLVLSLCAGTSTATRRRESLHGALGNPAAAAR